MDGENPQVLVVDDDPVHRRLQVARLEALGYVVSEVAAGAAAIERLTAEDGPRLALVDVSMPDIDGIEVCRRVRDAPLDAYRYLLLLTAREDPADVVRGLDAGADDYLRKPVAAAELGARVRAGMRILRLEEQLRAAREALRREATVDALTGLLNRRGVATSLRLLVAGVPRGHAVSIALVDVDRFKGINDEHGHSVGDAVLREIADRLRGAIRVGDVLARWGGEEFLVVLPRAAEAAALTVAERMRNAVGGRPFRVGPELSVTASFGVATSLPGHPVSSPDALVEAADQALYTAKRTGRNRSVGVVAVDPATPADGGADSHRRR